MKLIMMKSGKKWRMSQMINNIYYESLILEQKLNYFILESRYNEIVLNESIADKLKSVKKWITERFN